jgi:hypothetical protein
VNHSLAGVEGLSDQRPPDSSGARRSDMVLGRQYNAQARRMGLTILAQDCIKSSIDVQSLRLNRTNSPSASLSSGFLTGGGELLKLLKTSDLEYAEDGFAGVAVAFFIGVV